MKEPSIKPSRIETPGPTSHPPAPLVAFGRDGAGGELLESVGMMPSEEGATYAGRDAR
jgi:hypothetical protein